ncbi:MAG: DNA methylase [Bacteroidia bacterium]|nr:DNA methylase [Bacteroidia bacterium]
MSKQDKVICLGKEFNSEEERREYFRNELRTKLNELKKIEGFPIGEDEDIVNLSDPPYYTACPNPWLNDFIVEWEKEKENIKGRKKDFHVDEPYARDISEGKNNPIYNVHTYHTKVPHPAIMRYILHYTQPGDIVFDGFGGTGMTGVAAFMCGLPNRELKYIIENEWRINQSKLPNWGIRKAICSDLSPIAAFISYNYNSPIIIDEYQKIFDDVLLKLEMEYDWMFLVKHTNGKFGKLNYIVWSEVLVCPNCNSEIIYFDLAVKRGEGMVLDEFKCEHCKTLLAKTDCDKKMETKFDIDINEIVSIVKYVPVFINYKYDGKKYEKKPDNSDFELIDKIESHKNPYWFPKYEIPKGDKTGEPIRMGLKSIYQLYTKRNLLVLSFLWKHLPLQLRWIATSFLSRNLTKCNRFIVNNHNPNGRINGPLTGTLYIPSEVVEQSAIELFKDKAIDFSWETNGNLNQVSSASDLKHIKTDSVDYIFTDPPFGANYMYSELNFIWESWLKVRTDNKDEAIENKTQQKGPIDYADLMTKCFSEYYRILKPDCWMTVEFSNTNAAIWNAIQNSLQRSGFIISNVSALDKIHGGIKSMWYTTSVKQDLIISCYKPTSAIQLQVATDSNVNSVWNFIEEHLKHLPIHLKADNKTTAIIERNPKILNDRLVKYYLLNNISLPISVNEFQEGLRQRFSERDGMFFTHEQVVEYDIKKAKNPKFIQLSLLVSSENDGIEWLKNELRRPQTVQSLHPKWLKAIAAIRKNDILPELKDILNLSFIQESDGRWRTPDTNEAKDREALRTKVLLKEFVGYVTTINQPKAKKLKEVRVEALRAGFKNSWEQKDFKTIVTLGDMIPQNILLEDEQLLMYYDIAKDRV